MQSVKLFFEFLEYKERPVESAAGVMAKHNYGAITNWRPGSINLFYCAAPLLNGVYAKISGHEIEVEKRVRVWLR